MSDYTNRYNRRIGFGGSMRGYDTSKDPNHPDFGVIEERDTPSRIDFIPGIAGGNALDPNGTKEKEKQSDLGRNLFSLYDQITGESDSEKKDVPKPTEKPKHKLDRNSSDLLEKIEVPKPQEKPDLPKGSIWKIPKPQEKPVDFEKESKDRDFDKDGFGEHATILLNPLSALKVNRIAETTKLDMQKMYPDRIAREDNDVDAVRHALWSYRLTKELGVDVAKKFTDAHERDPTAKKDSILMDLENNEMGRILAQHTQNHDRNDIEVIKDALKKRLLRVKPYPLRE